MAAILSSVLPFLGVNSWFTGVVEVSWPCDITDYNGAFVWNGTVKLSPDHLFEVSSLQTVLREAYLLLILNIPHVAAPPI